MIATSQALIKSFADLHAKKIGLLGGTFDPPHYGHLQIAKENKKRYQLDCVVFIPAKKNPLKDSGPIASDAERIRMLELLVAGEEGLFVSNLEVISSEPSFTFNTLQKIKSEIDPKAELHLILGTDNLFDQNGKHTSLPYWKNMSEIFKLANLSFVARDSFKPEELSLVDREKYSLEEWQEIERNIIPLNLSISATQIRTGIYQPDFPKDILPVKVSDYITANKIYLPKANKLSKALLQFPKFSVHNDDL